MRALINCSNLRQGGGIQVADSICSLLGQYEGHQFYIVLPTAMSERKDTYNKSPNVDIVIYDMPKSFESMFLLRDRFLDAMVKDMNCDVVLTVFGPSRWRPRVPHLSGFARAHILPLNTPYLKDLSLVNRIANFLVKQIFNWSANNYWTENDAISCLLKKVFPKKDVFTISNTYNQVFDNKEKWTYHRLPDFEGVSLLTITNAYPHKNLSIALDIAKIFNKKYPSLKIRFVMTIEEKEFPAVPSYLRDYFLFIGKVDISECPSLYEQVDIMFQPSLLECFTATYAEAMRMEVPIVTTNLDFAVGLCKESACYYSPIDPQSAVNAIYNVITDKEYAKLLLDNGKKQLLQFGNYEQRVDKLIHILETIVKK